MARAQRVQGVLWRCACVCSQREPARSVSVHSPAAVGVQDTHRGAVDVRVSAGVPCVSQVPGGGCSLQLLVLLNLVFPGRMFGEFSVPVS